MYGAQRAQVSVPSALALPSSSPAAESPHPANTELEATIAANAAAVTLDFDFLNAIPTDLFV